MGLAAWFVASFGNMDAHVGWTFLLSGGQRFGRDRLLAPAQILGPRALLMSPLWFRHSSPCPANGLWTGLCWCRRRFWLQTPLQLSSTDFALFLCLGEEKSMNGKRKTPLKFTEQLALAWRGMSVTPPEAGLCYSFVFRSLSFKFEYYWQFSPKEKLQWTLGWCGMSVTAGGPAPFLCFLWCKFITVSSRRWSSWVTAQPNPTGSWLFYLLLVEDNLKIYWISYRKPTLEWKLDMQLRTWFVSRYD